MHTLNLSRSLLIPASYSVAFYLCLCISLPLFFITQTEARRGAWPAAALRDAAVPRRRRLLLRCLCRVPRWNILWFDRRVRALHSLPSATRPTGRRKDSPEEERHYSHLRCCSASFYISFSSPPPPLPNLWPFLSLSDGKCCGVKTLSYAAPITCTREAARCRLA